MLRHHRTLLALAPLLLAGCYDNGNDYYGYSGPTANFQVLNASPDAPDLNVLIDGQPAFCLYYGQGTGELWIPSGSHTVTVQALTPAGATTLIGPTTLTFDTNNDYVVVAEGPVATIGSVVFPHPLSVVAATATRVQILHAAPSLPAVAVFLTAPGADLATSTPLGSGSVSFMGAIGPNDVASGQYEIRITPAGATSPVLYDSGTITLVGGTDLVFSVLQNTGPGPASVTLAAVDSYGDNSRIYDVSTPANVRAVNASPDAPAIAVIANGNVTTPFVPSLAFEAFADYAGLTPGSTTLAITPASNTSDVLASQSLNLDAGSEHTIYAMGKLATLVTQVTWDNRRRVALEAKLRLIDGSPSAGNVDIYLTAPGAGIATASPTYAAVPFQGDTKFQGFTAGSYDLTVTPAGSKTAAIGPVTITLVNSGIYTAVVRDAPAGGAPYGLILLDDFGP